MKIKRQKRVRKVLTFYKSNFGYHVPYKILVDGTFCKAALKDKINIQEQLPKYLDAEIKLCTTPCALGECESMGSLLYGPLKVLRQYEVWNCRHPTIIPASKCLASIIKKRKEHKFFIATQDKELSEKIRSTPGAPLLFISFNAITLEAPSDASKLLSETKTNQVTSKEHENIEVLKKEMFGETEAKKKRKKRGPSGPNPLSCKKKFKKDDKNQTEDKQKNKRRRKRRRKGEDEIDEQLKLLKSGQTVK